MKTKLFIYTDIISEKPDNCEIFVQYLNRIVFG